MMVCGFILIEILIVMVIFIMIGLVFMVLLIIVIDSDEVFIEKFVEL